MLISTREVGCGDCCNCGCGGCWVVGKAGAAGSIPLTAMNSGRWPRHCVLQGQTPLRRGPMPPPPPHLPPPTHPPRAHARVWGLFAHPPGRCWSHRTTRGLASSARERVVRTPHPPRAAGTRQSAPATGSCHKAGARHPSSHAGDADHSESSTSTRRPLRGARAAACTKAHVGILLPNKHARGLEHDGAVNPTCAGSRASSRAVGLGWRGGVSLWCADQCVRVERCAGF